eukprot:7480511-Heterocapsa_arctica.AAC.1
MDIGNKSAFLYLYGLTRYINVYAVPNYQNVFGYGNDWVNIEYGQNVEDGVYPEQGKFERRCIAAAAAANHCRPPHRR